MSLPTAASLERDARRERLELRRAILLTALAALGLALGLGLQLAGAAPLWPGLAFGLAYLAGGGPAARSAWRALRRGKLPISLLMVLAALAAAAVGEARDGAILLVLFSLAETLESVAMGNTRRAVTALMSLRPDEAHRLRSDGSSETVGVEGVAPGERILVKPGERVPLDGRVLAGQSAVDQSPVTGESAPLDRGPGDEVFAGTLNGYGALELSVTRPASDSTLARMVALVTEAQATRAPSERFSDWFGQRYTALVLLGSLAALGSFVLLGFAPGEAFYRAATLLVVASPCAIVISVPAAVLSALAASARGGVLFKGGAALEDFGNVRVVAFDKTGTLTEGRMRVTDVIPFGLAETELLARLSGLERASEHPIARSVLAAASARGVAPRTASKVEALPGMGLAGVVAGEPTWSGNRKLAAFQAAILEPEVERALGRLEGAGKTTLLVGVGERVIGLVGVADTPRASAREMLERLRGLGVERFVMLTGDHPGVARAVAAELGLDPADVHAGLLPEDKVRLVRELSASSKIAYVGDGVNDAAALASASVGVAMGAAGSDAALEAADVALLSNDLRRLPEGLALARRAQRVIRQNLAFALGIMALMVLVTLFGRLPLPLGVLGHEGGTLLVVLNGLRLLRSPAREAKAPTLERLDEALVE